MASMTETPFQRIAVVGAGAWGTALAIVAGRAGRDVVVVARKPDVAMAINERHENPAFLPGVRLDAAITASTDAAAVADADVVLLAAPAQHVRMVAGQLAAHVRDGTPVVICAKGIERGSGKLMSDVVAEALPGARLAILSGPTFAGEVARGLPTAVTLAAVDRGLGARLLTTLGSAGFRPYLSDDITGVQIGGAVKNVIAIACGIVTGRGLGDNARAALMARGLAEMMRLGTALGGRRDTLMGLSGLGDLSLTCNGPQSRNMSLGMALGRGLSLDEALAGRRAVVEGVDSAEAVNTLAARVGVEMPIVSAVHAILHEEADIDTAIASLLARPFKNED